MVFSKYRGNPVLSADAFPDDIMYVFNPGAVKYNGEYLLVVDAATAATPIVFWIARSRDGIHFTPDPAPVRDWPALADGRESCIYDPRITFIDGEYILMYASHTAEHGVRTGVVRTKDFHRFERIAQSETCRQNRNSVLFPEKINGRYVRFDRPMSDNAWDPSDMCISYSEDLCDWSDTRTLMRPRPGYWDSHKIGGGAVPIKTPEGWLAIYHGVDKTCNGFIYRLGVMLLDLENPEKIISRGVLPVLWPDQPYEMFGRVANVTFGCNALPEPDGTVRIYYGAADTCVGLACAELSELIAACRSGNPTAEAFFAGGGASPEAAPRNARERESILA